MRHARKERAPDVAVRGPLSTAMHRRLHGDDLIDDEAAADQQDRNAQPDENRHGVFSLFVSE
jgi:hypothetical protein